MYNTHCNLMEEESVQIEKWFPFHYSHSLYRHPMDPTDSCVHRSSLSSIGLNVFENFKNLNSSEMPSCKWFDGDGDRACLDPFYPYSKTQNKTNNIEFLKVNKMF